MKSLVNYINEKFEYEDNIDIQIYESMVSDNINESFLFDLKKVDMLELIGMVKNPSKYSKAYITRWLVKKLNNKNLLNDDVTKIIDSVLKYYAVFTGKEKLFRWF